MDFRENHRNCPARDDESAARHTSGEGIYSVERYRKADFYLHRAYLAAGGPLGRRGWVVGRSFAWAMHFRRLARDLDGDLDDKGFIQ